MKSNTQQHPLEPKIQKMIEGYRGFEPSNQPLTFGDQQMLPDDVIGRLQKAQLAFEEVRRLHAEREEAIAVRDAMIPGLEAFHDQAMEVARQHFGANPKKMASFGVTQTSKPTSRSRRRACGDKVEEVVTTVVEAVTIVSEQASCESKAPSCEEPPRKPPCRAKSKPSRVKPPCEEQKACGSRVSRGRR